MTNDRQGAPLGRSAGHHAGLVGRATASVRLVKTLCGVVSIEDWQGRRGGWYWRLGLTCGHAVLRRKPKRRDTFAGMMRPLEFAPERVACESCGAIRRAEFFRKNLPKFLK